MRGFALLAAVMAALSMGPARAMVAPATGPQSVDPQSSAVPVEPVARPFVITNGGKAALKGLFISPSSLDQWGPELLGDLVVAPGAAVEVVTRFNDCKVDVQALFGGGSEDSRMEYDRCAEPALILEERGRMPVNERLGAQVRPLSR